MADGHRELTFFVWADGEETVKRFTLVKAI
jgi:hypothetical protein